MLEVLNESHSSSNITKLQAGKDKARKSRLNTLKTNCFNENRISLAVNSPNLKRGSSLIPPYSDTAESLIKIMRIKEMIANLRSFDC